MRAHDPAITELPRDLATCIELAHSPLGAAARASALVVATPWPEYQQIRNALDEYLNDATERIIREEVYRDTREAPERGG